MTRIQVAGLLLIWPVNYLLSTDRTTRPLPSAIWLHVSTPNASLGWLYSSRSCCARTLVGGVLPPWCPHLHLRHRRPRVGQPWPYMSFCYPCCYMRNDSKHLGVVFAQLLQPTTPWLRISKARRTASAPLPGRHWLRYTCCCSAASACDWAARGTVGQAPCRDKQGNNALSGNN